MGRYSRFLFTTGKTVALFTLLCTLQMCRQGPTANPGTHKAVGLSEAQHTNLKLGAYYFDGWSGLTQGHITQELIDNFPEREPVWGWLTSQQPVMNAQIEAAAEAGIDFFSFCWYYPEHYSYEKEPLNRALSLYLQAPNRTQLQFNVLVVNHEGFIISPKEWNTVSRYWLDLFKNPLYLQVKQKPLLMFFSAETLVRTFGSAAAVHQALDSLRTAAQQEGLSGVTIAACTNPDSASIALAQQSGFDVLTGYNYHAAGFQGDKEVIPIDSLISGSYRAWQRFTETDLPYIPVATLNWDPRPWARPDNNLGSSPRYVGYSAASVYKAVKCLREWMRDNPDKTTPEQIALLYAWNEYGEGAWLSPSKNQQKDLLRGVKEALAEE